MTNTYVTPEDEMNEAEKTMREFDGWCEGFVVGSRLSEEPHIFVKIRLLAYERLEQLQKQCRKSGEQV